MVHMGKLVCLKCKETVEAETFSEADSLIDHAVNSQTCSGSPSYLRWNGGTTKPKENTVRAIQQEESTATKKKSSSRK